MINDILDLGFFLGKDILDLGYHDESNYRYDLIADMAYLPKQICFNDNQTQNTVVYLSLKFKFEDFLSSYPLLISVFCNELPGLPPRYRDSVRQITPGLPLFLYNYSTHQLHGVFEVCIYLSSKYIR